MDKRSAVNTMSQMLRFIDKLNHVENVEDEVREIKRNIQILKNEPPSAAIKKNINKLYDMLDELLFKPDYMCVIMDRKKDYLRACEGFTVNGIKYARLLGTNGGVKMSTIVFVSERLVYDLRILINNGRDLTKALVPAKFEAYRALTCSGSTPVSRPKGVAIVNDCITHFKSDVIELNDENDGEPVMTFVKDADVELDESDGYGLMLPSLAERWSADMHLDYVVSGVNTRMSWEKGMVFTFDFLEFADNVAGTRIIKDAWGDEVDLSNVDLILTTSMVKLWDSYESCEHYLACSYNNGYEFCIAKTSPKNLDSERYTNYQFLQSYELSDDDIEELIAPTLEEIHDILGGDVDKTILFLKGAGLNEGNIDVINGDFAKALMIDKRVMNDSFVRKKIYGMIKSRINNAKIGVIKVHGNYSIISGDPYSLCQSIFEIPVTGLLKAGEIYNKFWVDDGASEVACFRAPMSTHSNIRRMKIANSEEMAHWYRYMNTVTLLNSWDTAAHALNGCDKDGDLIFTTNNRVLVDNLRDLPALMCFQRKAKKVIPTEEILIQANIDSFGDDIGKVTNRITAMYDVQAKYDKDSIEYQTLEYRIMSGQQLQQNAIDKAKGIVAKPMPKTWYSYAVNKNDINIPIEQAELNLRILADKKPYFMIYIYPTLKKDFRNFDMNTKRNSIRKFMIPIDELLSMPEEELTEEMADFKKNYYKVSPVGMNDCVINKICWRVEEEFDGYLSEKEKFEKIDKELFKSDDEYQQSQYNSIYKEYKIYVKNATESKKDAHTMRLDGRDALAKREDIKRNFIESCERLVPNRFQLCNIIIDMCYSRESSKQLAWDVSGETIIYNLLRKNEWKIRYPEYDINGDVLFRGSRFTFRESIMEQ